MLELCGRRFVIDHAISELIEERNRMVFQVYMTDAAKALLEVAARAHNGNVQIRRFADIYAEMNEPNDSKAEARTEEEIIENIRAKITRMNGGDAE